MTRLIVFLTLAAALGLASGVMADPSFLSTSGLILTPDDTVLGAGDFSADYHGISFDVATPNILGANIGVNDYLELGIARLDPDSPGADIQTALSAKYLVLAETAGRPSFVIGTIDAGGALDVDDDPSFYALIGKSLTSTATSISGRPSAPIRGYVGIGTGIYDGVFGGVSIALGSRVKLMAEYLNGIRIQDTLDTSAMVNAGLQINVVEGLTAQVAVLDGQDIGFAVNYIRQGF